MQTKAYLPKTLTQLYDALKLMTPDSKIIGGGTDLAIRLRDCSCRPDALLYMGGVEGVRDIALTPNGLEIGGMVTMTELAASSHTVGYYAALAHAAADVGAVQIRNSATVGGNLGNASPAGDLMPVWELLGAQVEIATPGGNLRRAHFAEVFLGPGKTGLNYNEAVVRFIVPPPASQTAKSAFVKLGSRKTLTISRIGLAGLLEVDGSGIVTRFQLVAGAISPTPIHVTQAEEYLLGKRLALDEAAKVGALLSDLIMRVARPANRNYKASGAYGVAEDLLAKLIAE